jgi:hypothetical protein
MRIIDLNGNRESKVLLKRYRLYRELDSWIDIYRYRARFSV